MFVLIVDDHEDNLYLLKSLLEGNGHSVGCALNGKEALEKLAQASYDLIVSDILMPEMDGFSLCKKIRSHPDWNALPFIFYTATYTGPQDEALARELGADGFIVKPCEPDSFLAQLEDLAIKASSKQASERRSQSNDEDILKMYNERLVRKLEQKMSEMEKEVQAKLTALDALQRNESLLNATQSISKIGGWEYNIKENKLFWTKETQRIYEIDSQDIPDDTDRLLELSLSCYPNELRSQVENAFENCVQMGEPYEMELAFTTIKGNQLMIKTSGQPVVQNGVITKVIGYIQDITAQKKQEKEKEELQEQLRQSQKLESIGQLAGGIAHDFNNILTIVMGYSEEIMASLPPDNVIHQDAYEIVKAGQRAQELTRKLLAFSRKQLISPQILNPNRLIKEFQSMLIRLIGEDVEFITILAEEVNNIIIDPGQFEQVVMNIVINARDAMPHGGTLKIITQNYTVHAPIKPFLREIPVGEYVQLVISDTGCGMDKETQEKIFEPFFTTKGQTTGTGLGLATVYGIVRQSGGYIWMSSEPGKGSEFYLLFPVCNQEPTDNVKANDDAVMMGNGECILVVDDDPHIRNLALKQLKSMNYNVTVASNAREALKMILENGFRPELVISDVVMPGMNGKDLADLIVLHNPNQKILFISGYADNAIQNHGVFDDRYPILQKPFTKQVIARQIKSLLQE